MAKLTKVELEQQNLRLAEENQALRTALADKEGLILALKAQAKATVVADNFIAQRYPLVDARGRRYRIEGRMKCYAPSNH
jgi:hypothetical protein